MLKNLVSTILWLCNMWNNLKGWKSLISGCLMHWLIIKKIVLNCCWHYLEVSSFLIVCNNKELFLNWIVTCGVKWFYMTTSDDQLSGWMVKKVQSISQNQTCTQKTSWSLFGGLLHIWSTVAFWIPMKPVQLKHAQQIDEMHWRLQHL